MLLEDSAAAISPKCPETVYQAWKNPGIFAASRCNNRAQFGKISDQVSEPSPLAAVLRSACEAEQLILASWPSY